MVANASFETTDSSSYALANSWTLSGTAQTDSFALAEFTSDAYTAEDFERGWSSNEDRIAAFVGIGTDLTAGSFDSTTPEAFEDFEEEWSSNENRLVEFGSTVAGVFDAALDAFEDFEEEWSSNENRKTAFTGIGVDLTAGSFDSGTPEAFEDFEEEWSSNENRKTAFTGIGVDLTAGLYWNTSASASLAYEDFGVLVILPVIAGAGASGVSRTIDRTGMIEVRISGTWSATLEIQVQRDGFSSWVAVDDNITSNGTTELEAGITAVRMHTSAYSSGTPGAHIIFRDIDTV